MASDGWGRHIGVTPPLPPPPPSLSSSSETPASYTAGHVDHEKRRHGFSFYVSPISIGMGFRLPALRAGEAPLLRNIVIFRAKYNHEIYAFSNVNIEPLIIKKYEIKSSVSDRKIKKYIYLKGPASSCHWRNKIEIKNLNGPALLSHAERIRN